MYRNILAENVIPAPNPGDRFGGAEAHLVFSAAKKVDVCVWGVGDRRIELSCMPMQHCNGDGTFTENPIWLVDSEGGYRRVASGTSEASPGGPLYTSAGVLPINMIRALIERGLEIAAIVMAHTYEQKDCPLAVQDVLWCTSPPTGWPLL